MFRMRAGTSDHGMVDAFGTADLIADLNDIFLIVEAFWADRR